MHRPTTFNDMILLAERADQAFIADNRGMLQSCNFRGFSGNNNRGHGSNVGRGNFGNFGNCG